MEKKLIAVSIVTALLIASVSFIIGHYIGMTDILKHKNETQTELCDTWFGCPIEFENPWRTAMDKLCKKYTNDTSASAYLWINGSIACMYDGIYLLMLSLTNSASHQGDRRTYG